MKLVASVGGVSSGTPAAIAYLWTNWHDYFYIDRALFQVRRLSKASWEASAHSIPGSGEWHLLEAKYGVSHGYFRFISYVKFAGQLVRGESSFLYQEHLGGERWYVAETNGRLPPLLGPIAPLLAPVVAGITKEFGGNGGKVAAEITRRPELVERKCGVAALEKYREYIADENLIRNGGASKPEHMSADMDSEQGDAELLDQLFGTTASEFRSLVEQLDTSVEEMALLRRATVYARYRMPFAGQVMLGWLAERLWRRPEFRATLERRTSRASSLAEFAGAKNKMVWVIPEGEQRFATDMRRFGDLYLKLVRLGAAASDRHG